MSPTKVIHYIGSVFKIHEVISTTYFDHWPTINEINTVVEPLIPYVRDIDTGRGSVIDFGSSTEFLYICPIDVDISENMRLIEF